MKTQRYYKLTVGEIRSLPPKMKLRNLLVSYPDIALNVELLFSTRHFKDSYQTNWAVHEEELEKYPEYKTLMVMVYGS